jgi:hypothetical protein
MTALNEELAAPELDAIEARADCATPGPWRSFVEGRDHSSGSSFIQTAINDIELCGATVGDQDFIANARSDVPALVREVRRLKAFVGGSPGKRRYVLEGQAFASLDEFASHFSSVVLENHAWNGNLDAFNDILRGGFGTPEEGFVLHWHNHAISRLRLGHSEMARRLAGLLQTCHPSNASAIEHSLSLAQGGQGPMLFDLVVEIIRDHGTGGAEADDGVELILA